jgi:penicillin-binding protein 2
MRLGSPDNSKVFTRRAFVLGAMQGSLLAVLGGRLAWLQIAQGERYKMLSEENRINIRIISPSRGQIVDRFGVPLAVNNQNFRAMVIPEQTENLEQSLRALQKFITVEEQTIQKILKQSKKTQKFVPLEVKDNLNWDEVSTVEVNVPDLPGLSVNVGELRSYPFGEATAHIIGYVGGVSESEMTDDPLLSLPGFKVGKSGIEKKHDFAMRGSAGTAEVEVNVVGREIRELTRNPAEAGKRVALTIDAELQRFAQQTLSKERSASAAVIDVHTGAVYALASHPAFDPNVFARGIPQPVWMELSENPANPLVNKAVAGQYPPGSTFKMVTALAGLKAQKISRERSVYCPGHYDLGTSRFHCWKPGGHGWVNLEAALAGSCDVYFYTVGKDTGIDAIADTAKLLGFGGTFGFDLEEERPGLVPDRDWKQANRGEAWQLGETLNTAIGQGFLKTTPLQMAIMTARLVNGGYAVKPWLTGYVGDDAGTKKTWPKMDINPKHLELIRSGMNMVVNDPHGTAYGSRITEAGWMMGGKTGTAQVRRITKQMRAQGVKNEDLPWHFRHHALFVGYAPVDNPKYACAVIVEHGVGGAKAAAPMARDLLLEVQRRNPAKQEPQPESHARSTEGFGPVRKGGR